LQKLLAAFLTLWLLHMTVQCLVGVRINMALWVWVQIKLMCVRRCRLSHWLITQLLKLVLAVGTPLF
jgi:hypothetical protein